MGRYRKQFLRGVGTILFLFILAGCASSTSGSPYASGAAGASPQAAAPAAPGEASVKVAQLSIGNVLVNANGMTLYILTSDPDGQSTCSGGCAAAWPPDTVSGAPAAGQGVDSSLLGTFTRADGSQQVTYAGHPLYTYRADSSPGNVNGQGITSFGGTWYVLGADGQPVTSSMSSSSGGLY